MMIHNHYQHHNNRIMPIVHQAIYSLIDIVDRFSTYLHVLSILDVANNDPHQVIGLVIDRVALLALLILVLVLLMTMM
jgi:ribosome-associated toxin RatA of RatAB toxin-antitoxin module